MIVPAQPDLVRVVGGRAAMDQGHQRILLRPIERRRQHDHVVYGTTLGAGEDKMLWRLPIDRSRDDTIEMCQVRMSAGCRIDSYHLQRTDGASVAPDEDWTWRLLRDRKRGITAHR